MTIRTRTRRHRIDRAMPDELFQPSPLAPRPTPVDEARDRDLGFGTVVGRESRQRLLNRDGSFNVVRSGLGLLDSLAPYHHLLTMSWPAFMAVVGALYLLINLLFAAADVVSGPTALVGPGADMLGGRLSQAFFFSVQTFATIGYGQIGPNGLAANLLVTTEALVGLMYQALATGLLFARFARPTASILFSRTAVVAPYNDGQALMFRIANRRRNEIVKLAAQVLFSELATDSRGGRTRTYTLLPLERSQVMFFPLAWTVCIPLTRRAPWPASGRRTWSATRPRFSSCSLESTRRSSRPSTSGRRTGLTKSCGTPGSARCSARRTRAGSR